MTSSANSAEAIRQSTSSVPEALARRLLDYEAVEKTSPEGLAAAGEHIYLRLRARLAVMLGSTGFDALWARAMHLAQAKFRPGKDITTAEAPMHASHAYGLHAAMHGRNLDAVQYNLMVAFASFITLLFTFIGEELGLHFIYQIWLSLPPDAAASRAEEATQ